MSATSSLQRSRKPAKLSTPGTSSQAAAVVDQRPPPPFFPFARYTSIVGVHTSLLTFTSLFLPRTSLTTLLRASASENEDQAPGDVLTSLTENPLRTVIWTCVGAAVLQVWWATWLQRWHLDTQTIIKGSADESAQRAEQKLLRQERKGNRLTAFRGSCIATTVGAFAFSILAILYGAPLNSHLFPYLCPRACSSRSSLRLTWIRLFAELSPRTPIDRALLYPVIGTVLGCWAGAIPLGLDWERPWQQWPLPPVYGAISGYIIGSLLALAENGVRQLYYIQLQENQDAANSQAQQKGEKKKGK
ncbi:hypothetical protein QCA50_013421 [Cerrena zonata]|uniref:Phosphatidylinositol-glycan biosynthesis class F protein n=1 Tax=Cerrena zonata TaxID=2478898 RepID=A0AAW0G0Z4_9APHY